MKTLTFTLALAAWLPLAACSSDDDKAETRDDFCQRWAEAACNDEVVSVCQAASADACRLSQQRACLDLVPQTGFVSDRADACIAAVKSAYSDANLDADELDTVLRLDAPCDRLVRGPRASGESCMTRLDCDGPGGYDCLFRADQALGSCQKPAVVEPGRDCSADDAVCTEGFYCNGSNCVEGAAVGTACTRNDQCGDGFCGPDDVCAAGLATDAPCAFDAQCSSGLCYRFSDTERVCTDRVRLSRTDPQCEISR